MVIGSKQAFDVDVPFGFFIQPDEIAVRSLESLSTLIVGFEDQLARPTAYVLDEDSFDSVGNTGLGGRTKQTIRGDHPVPNSPIGPSRIR